MRRIQSGHGTKPQKHRRMGIDPRSNFAPETFASCDKGGVKIPTVHNLKKIMAGEALAGIVSLKRAAFDLAQEIKEIDDAARRGANVCLRRHKLSQSRLVQSNPASRPELDIIQGRV